MDPDQIAANQFQDAQTDLQSSGPVEVVLRFYRRHDALLAVVADAAPEKTACRAGCWYCCYYKVEATAAEVLGIVEHVKARRSPDQLQALIEEVSANVDATKGLTYEQHLATNQKCPFLVDQRCSIYDVRPTKCRNFHAQDVEGCRQSYERPLDLTTPPSYVPTLKVAGEASEAGFRAAVEAAGVDNQTYDFNSALLEALTNPAALKRFNKGKRPFLHAVVVAPPAE